MKNAIETRFTLPPMDPNCKTSVDGYSAYQWPEFIALAQRLGVPLDKPIQELTLVFRRGEAVGIWLAQRGSDTLAADEPTVYDTTNVHNKKVVTKAPVGNS